MRVLCISFVTKPGSGSEGGVGWAFLRAAALATGGGTVDFIFDQRDFLAVRDALSTTDWGDAVNLHPVKIPEFTLKRVGNSRTRTSYLAWAPAARSVAKALAHRYEYDGIHQFTFATSSLPPIHALFDQNCVWGPIAAPEGKVSGWGETRPTIKEYAAVVGGSLASRLTSRHINTVICQNSYTQDKFNKLGLPTLLEPNIIAERTTGSSRNLNDVIFAGNLVDRKRPWIALQAMNHKSMGNRHLHIVGSGPLRAKMESYVRQERLDARVTFHGRLERAETMRRIANSGCLILPSSREGAGWVVGEAAAAGVPSVVTRGTGAATIVQLSGNLGISIPEKPDNSGLFREGIQHCIDRAHTYEASSRWTEKRLPSVLANAWNKRDSQ